MSGRYFVRGSDTSEAAAFAVDDLGPLEAEVAGLIHRAGEHGMTCSEVEEAIPYKTHQSLSARIKGLVDKDRVVDSGQRRKGASGRLQRVYVTAPEPGQQSLL